MYKCCSCGKMFDIKNFGEYLSFLKAGKIHPELAWSKRRQKFCKMLFCSAECYENYLNNFIVETYKKRPIYCINVNGENRYVPYFGCAYYFTDIEDCRKRIDKTNMAIVASGSLRLTLLGIE